MDPALGLREAVADLLTGARCLGCERPGRLLCRACADELPTRAHVARPRPCPPGLAPPWVVAAYGGLVRDLVVGHKERRQLALRAPLGRMLAGAVRGAVRGAVAESRDGATVVLVPVPSRRAVVRARGHDPLGAVVATAARGLRVDGHRVVVAGGLLATRGAVADQAGLDAAARRANLTGSMWCPGLSRWARRLAGARVSVVVCDDVVTTGSTLAEAQRALESVGLSVTAHAAVAATPRRDPLPCDPRLD